MSVLYSRLGVLFVVSGPSGSGKTTICHTAQEKADCHYSISCTTRKPRKGEVDGVDYYFLDNEEFEEKIKNSEFLEYAEVHGKYYGTLRSSVEDILKSGNDVVIDIDVQGAQLIRECDEDLIKQCRVDLFILPPSIDELKGRLRGRGTETDEELDLRIKNAIMEMKDWQSYRYTILSGSREEDFSSFLNMLEAERQVSDRLKPEVSAELE